MTATLHHLPPPHRGIPLASGERLLEAARALSRMAPALATSIECVGVDGPIALVTSAAHDIAARFDLVASVKTEPRLTVRFSRR